MRGEASLATLSSVGLRILIVDDNEAFLDAARALLEREGQSIVGVATSSAEALGRAEELRPDVVLVDIVLADESGFELVRRLVERDPDNGAAVILVSTHAEEDLADLITASPAAGFVPKSKLSAEAIRRIVSAPRGT